MSGTDESRGRVRQMREKAKELDEAAGRSSDPKEAQRLKDKAQRLKAQSDQESAMGTGDIYPDV
ncbi:DUF6381 family protein [Streptomyces genisteinicus]|uniref:Small hydrophilic protein n=1 Tax=Streptomyces genisteinicus TaxID=2768068 RepID=A0A7H0HMR3_9ACTN|nr:DUF6381 family protein [Streptomyces genisteinicus]QNP61829.1 small hydrophilic protein [Streptomyces genisteinicus]